MKLFILILLFISNVFAEYNSTTTATIDCNQIFELRKQEILTELRRVDEREQSFLALKDAQNELLEKKELYIKQKQNDLNATLQKIEDEKDAIRKLKEKNEQLLNDIKKAKDDKLTKTYQKMKDSKAAQILNISKIEDSAKILFNLSAKKSAKIMAKMEPDIASKITKLLDSGPPFDKNSTK
jgi:flagellar motility protein MotE (MotC chaperone)